MIVQDFDYDSVGLLDRRAEHRMTILAEGTDNFVWIPRSEPRRYGIALAALGVALIGIVCGYSIGFVRQRGFIDAFDGRTISADPGTAGEGQSVAEPRLIDGTHEDRSLVEHRNPAEPALMLSSHGKAGMPTKRGGGLKLPRLSGEPMRRLQAKVGVEADGAFGRSTAKALKAWQGNSGLAEDGVVGPNTLMMMGLCDLVLLRRGAHGDAVKKLQEELAIGADGQFGPRTGKAVHDYQKKNGLVADGRAGLATLGHMKLFKKLTADTTSQGSASPEVGAGQRCSR
jgi:hypothetical protein